MSDEYLTAAIYGMKRFNEGVKRIINMEKLDGLLKEFQLEKGDWVRIDGPETEISEKEELVLEATLISKKYGFIKWLVENEKIDEDEFSTIETFDHYESLLMRLAIDDEPIQFLVSILK